MKPAEIGQLIPALEAAWRDAGIGSAQAVLAAALALLGHCDRVMQLLKRAERFPCVSERNLALGLLNDSDLESPVNRRLSLGSPTTLRERRAGLRPYKSASTTAMRQLCGIGCKASVESARATIIGYLVGVGSVSLSAFVRSQRERQRLRK